MRAELKVVTEPDTYTETMRERLLYGAQDVAGSIGNILITVGQRISGQGNHRTTILEAFDIGYECGWRRCKQGRAAPDTDNGVPRSR